MTFPKYPEYKDSGVEWLGEVPAHWHTKPLKRVATYNDEVLAETTEDDYELKYVEISDVDEQSGIMSWSEHTFETAPSRARRRLKHGDVLISTVRTYLRAIAPVKNPPDNLIGSTGFAAIRPLAGQYDSALMGYTLRAEWFISKVISNSVGVSYPAINATDLARFDVPVPPLSEQATITAFLDHETTRIDALVKEQQRLIELLKEKRQAVISHAVTKGLDPDVPMKDSGVEWLGEVPAHWEVKSLMHLTPPDRKIMYGIVLPGPDFDDGVPIIKGGDVKPGRLSLEKLCRTDPKIEAKYERSRVTSGDIVYSIRGGIGDAEVVPEEISGSNLTQDAARVAPRDGVCNIWLLYALKSGPVFAQLEAKATGATIRGINIMDLKRVTLPVPPLQEQQQIVERLDFIIGKLDRLEKEAGAAIALMQEHRSALISAAVTGKIDVRGWQPAAGSSAPAETTRTEMV